MHIRGPMALEVRDTQGSRPVCTYADCACLVGYLWAGFLLAAASCGLVGSMAAFFVPRLLYDPGSYAQTMFLIRNPRPQGDISIAVQPLPENYSNLPLTIER